MSGAISATGSIETIIAGGSAVSPVIDLDGFALVAIQMPAAWTAANLTFQASITKDGTYYDVYDSGGNELTISASASKVFVDIIELASLRFIKVRSGTTGTPVLQADSRTINLIVKN